MQKSLNIPAPSNRCFLVTSPVPRNHLSGSPNSLARRVLVAGCGSTELL